jgi:hypothetical protein
MKKFLIVSILAALIVPATSLGSGPTGQDRENAARACRALRATLGPELFRQTYGTVQSNRRNAFGKCVSQWARTEHQNRISARAACSAEQADATFPATHDGKTFAEFYGTGPNHRNAFGRCVSSKAKAASNEARQNTVNAARSCKAERAQLGAGPFREKYGRNAGDRNAFGKCVSQLAKAKTA